METEIKAFDEAETRKKLALQTSTFHNPAVWDQMQKMVTVFIQSNALGSDTKNAAQLMMKLQAGYEMGMQAVEAMQSLYIVGGKISVWGNALTRRLLQFGYKITYIESTKTKCTVKVTHPDKQGFEAVETASIDDVPKEKQKGFAYLNYALRKLRWNALKMVVDFHCSEVLGPNMGVVDDDEVAKIESELKNPILKTSAKSKKDAIEVESVKTEGEPTLNEVETEAKKEEPKTGKFSNDKPNEPANPTPKLLGDQDVPKGQVRVPKAVHP